MNFTGFRCPYLRWDANTLGALAAEGFGYDASQAIAWSAPDEMQSDHYLTALKFYGAQDIKQYPSLPFLSGSIVRVPYCLPDDEALIERLKLPNGQAIASIWLEMLASSYADGELLALANPSRAHFPLQRGAAGNLKKSALVFTPCLDSHVRRDCRMVSQPGEGDL